MKQCRNFPMVLFVLVFLGALTAVYARGGNEDEYDGRTETMTKTFTQSMNGSLIVDLNVGADIEISGWNREDIEVEILKSGNAVDNVSVDFDQRDDELRIIARYLSRTNQNGNLKLLVKAPARTSVEFNTLGGDVAFTDLEGSFSGKTMGGDLTLEGLKGETAIETMGGDIDVHSSSLDGRVKTMGGDVEIELIDGGLEAVTMGGTVRYTGGGTTDSPVHLETMGGDIRVDKALSGIFARTMGGDITISEAAFAVEVNTMGGDVEIGKVNGSIDAETMGGSIEGQITSDGSDRDRHVQMHTMGGEITLTVPRDLAMEIRIELKTSKKARRSYQIITDFDLERSVVTDRSEIGNDLKSIEYATIITGSVSERHRIELSSIDGDIRLETER